MLWTLLASSASRQRSRHTVPQQHIWRICAVLLVVWTCTIPIASATFINFQNCLSRNVVRSRQLQFIPTNVSVYIDNTQGTRDLNFTIYGNVTGQTTDEPYRLPSDPTWSNSNDTFGKIIDISQPANLRSTLKSQFDVLTYSAYRNNGVAFCEQVVNRPCPVGPAFYVDPEHLDQLPAFTVGFPYDTSYAFSTIAAKITVVSGDEPALDLACISASITPDLGATITNALTYVPAAILASVAIATISAAIFSPWGTSDIFRWTSNYGRDEDLLRLVTPGFGDCLQYIQFVVLSGSLTLNYPGFYQPVVSQASWSILSFNESFITHGNGYQSLEDGIYNVNATHGLARLRQFVGPTEDADLWAGMAIYLIGIIVAVVVLCQLGFLIRWGVRAVSNTQEGDLRNKNIPFTFGNIIRIIFNYFLLPIIALSLFQLVVARDSHASVVATSAILLVLVMGAAFWIFRLIFTTRPRAHLFDDLPTLLLYGPLYNTYSDDAAPFSFIPVLLTVMRGIAIGAIQPSGIAQLIVLAVCEVILILTLNAFRPFQAQTSMNAYHTFFSVVRLATILLSVAFAAELKVSEARKGWIGYIILLLHAIVLVLGFFLNALQTVVEVSARLAGAGGEARGGLATVFGKRQLSKRGHRRGTRSSLGSQAAMLAADGEHKSFQRTRSLSANSGDLLGGRASSGFDQFSQGGDHSTLGRASPGAITPGGATSPFPSLPSGSLTGATTKPSGSVRPGEPMDPYYRPPRMRRGTLELVAAGEGNQDSLLSGGEQPVRQLKNASGVVNSDTAYTGHDIGEGPSMSPAYLRVQREDSDTNLAERPDYAVRESDFYYGVSRGPALSHMPTRRLKTGPADPVGPVASATGWLKTLFGPARKEKGKGFEVVRSTRAPPQMTPLEDMNSPTQQEPYRDNPDGPTIRAVGGSEGPHQRKASGTLADESDDDAIEMKTTPLVDTDAPALAPIDIGGGLGLPSRWNSQASSRYPKGRLADDAPSIPRKSSKRPPSADVSILEDAARPSHLRPDDLGRTPSMRLPFRSTEPSPSPERGPSAASSIGRPMGSSDDVDGVVSPIIGSGGVPRVGSSASDRPVSTGYVQQHIASESIQPGLYRLNSHLGTSAELVVDDPLRKSSSTARSEQSRSGR